MDFSILTGRTDSHITTLPQSEIGIHQKAFDSFIKLQDKAKKAGFELSALSGFRGYDQQKRIWNKKAKGEADLWDAQGEIKLSFNDLSETELLHTIMRWSAVPGGSRHHWGTDLDIIDLNVVPKNYQIQLIPEEVEEGGMFAPMHEWLDQQIKNDTAEGFFRPYSKDKNGVAKERWHISFSPLSKPAYESYDLETFQKNIEESEELLLKEHLLENSEELFKRYIQNISE